MATSYKFRVLIDSRDVDGRGYCKASALMGHLQEAATQAAEQGGFTRKLMLEKYHSFWMLARVKVSLRRPLRWGEELTMHTWHRGTGYGATMYRDFDLYVGEEPVGECISAWILADTANRKLLRLRKVEELADTDGGALCKEEKLYKLRCPEEMTAVEQRPMHYSDTDINGHVNNTRYADFACDTVRLQDLPQNRFLSGLQIDYLSECRPGQVITMTLGDGEEGKYVRGLDETGKGCFEVQLIFGEVVS